MKLQSPSIICSLDWSTVVYQRQQRPTHWTRHLSFSKTSQQHLQSKISSLIPTLSFSNSCVKQSQSSQHPKWGWQRWSKVRLYHLTLEPFDESLGRGIRDLAAQPFPLLCFHHLQQAPQVLHQVQRPQAPHERGGGGLAVKDAIGVFQSLGTCREQNCAGSGTARGLGTPRGGGCSWKGLTQPNSALVLGEGNSSRNKMGWSSGSGNATICLWGWGFCSPGWIPKAECAARDGTSSANALSHPAGTQWSKSHSTGGVQRKPCPAFSMQEYVTLLQGTGNFFKIIKKMKIN